MSHTPGPWDASYDWLEGCFYVLSEAGPVDTEADANLIAAAPDLLAALEAITPEYEPLDIDQECTYCGSRIYEPHHDDACAWAQARAAIAKAKGEVPVSHG